MEGGLKRGIYRDISEFHLSAAHADASVVRRCAELAGQHQLFLHAQVDGMTVEKLLQLYPWVRILWAHAGITASAATVERLLGQFPTLWIELALRSDVAPDGKLDPEWQSVFLCHPDRFMASTDRWVTSRWETLPAATQFIRSWLDRLPRDVAEQIAHKNAERVFAWP